MEKLQDGIWIIDVEGKTVFANPRMAEILGTSVAEMIARDSFEYVHRDDVPAARRLFEAKRNGDAKPFRFKLRRRDGVDVWVDVQGTPLYNAAGVFNGIVGTFTVIKGAHDSGTSLMPGSL